MKRLVAVLLVLTMLLGMAVFSYAENGSAAEEVTEEVAEEASEAVAEEPSEAVAEEPSEAVAEEASEEPAEPDQGQEEAALTHDPIDWSDYSIEELEAVRAELEELVLVRTVEKSREESDRSIEFTVEEVIVFTGSTYSPEYAIEALSDTAPEKTELVWESTNEKIATVDSKGVVTPKMTGKAFITCSAKDDEGVFAFYKVDVRTPVGKIVAENADIKLLISDANPDAAWQQIAYSITPEDAYCQAVRWSTSDDSVVTISDEGVATAVAAGSATITIESADESTTAPVSATIKVTVIQATEEIELNESSITILTKGTFNLSADALPETAADKSVNWVSSDESVAKVSAKGQVTGVSSGTAVISCIANDGSGATAECEVTVEQPVTGIKITSKAPTLHENDSVKLEYTVLPENANNKDLDWTSSDMDVVTVEDGVLSYAGYGTATVTCTAKDGSGKSASIKVTVTPTFSDKDIVTALNTSLGKYMDKSEFKVTSGDGIINVAFYPEGATVTVYLAVNGDRQSIKDWNSMVSTMKTQSKELLSTIRDTLMRKDLNVALYLCGDIGSKNAYLAIMEGVVLYDYVNDIDLLGMGG